MGKEPIQIETTDDEPITVGSVLKWGAIAGGTAATIIGGTLWIANMRTDITSLRQQAEYHESRITAVETHENQTDKTLTEMSKKLDGAVLILDRIDRKMGAP